MKVYHLRGCRMAAALAAAISVCAAHASQWTDLLPAGTADEALRGFVRPPAAISPSPSAAQPLSLTAAGDRPLARTQATLFQPAGWKRAGRTVGRISVESQREDVVTPIGNTGNWWAGWSHRDQDTDAFLSRSSYDARAGGDGNGNAWALGYCGSDGWRVGLGGATADSNIASFWQDEDGETVEGGLWSARDALRLGIARQRARYGWSLEWERADVADTLLFARNGSDTYSLGLRGHENAWIVSAWHSAPDGYTWAQIQRTRAPTGGPLAVAGWQRGNASGIDDRWALSLGRCQENAAGRESWLCLEWADSDRDIRGVALGGLLPGLGDRGRGVAAIGGRGVAVKYAHRRPLSGPVGLITAAAVAQTSTSNSYLLEEAHGMLGTFAPTHRRWYGADLTALSLTVGLDRKTPDNRLGLAATCYLGRFDSRSGRADYPPAPPGPPGPPGPPTASTRFDKAFHLALLWERRF